MKLNEKKLKEEFGRIRLIAALEPDTNLRKKAIVSTIFNLIENHGTTAIGHNDAFHLLNVDYNDVDWKVLKRHGTLNEAFEFHIKTTNKQECIDCEILKQCEKCKKFKGRSEMYSDGYIDDKWLCNTCHEKAEARKKKQLECERIKNILKREKVDFNKNEGMESLRKKYKELVLEDMRQGSSRLRDEAFGNKKEAK